MINNIEELKTFFDDLLEKKAEKLEIQDLRNNYIRLLYDNDSQYFDLKLTKEDITLDIRYGGIYSDDIISIDEDFFEYCKIKITKLYDERHQQLINGDKEKTFDVLYRVMGMERERKIKKILED